MEIIIRYFTVLRDLTGTREEKMNAEEGSTVEDVLKTLGARYGNEFERYIFSGREHRGLRLLFFVDGRNIEGSDGFKTRLKSGSVLAIMPPVAGG
nr:MoaD family protein [Candidatus Njordarchaeum guaymaensis]